MHTVSCIRKKLWLSLLWFVCGYKAYDRGPLHYSGTADWPDPAVTRLLLIGSHSGAQRPSAVSFHRHKVHPQHGRLPCHYLYTHTEPVQDHSSATVRPCRGPVLPLQVQPLFRQSSGGLCDTLHSAAVAEAGSHSLIANWKVICHHPSGVVHTVAVEL